MWACARDDKQNAMRLLMPSDCSIESRTTNEQRPESSIYEQYPTMRCWLLAGKWVLRPWFRSVSRNGEQCCCFDGIKMSIKWANGWDLVRRWDTAKLTIHCGWGERTVSNRSFINWKSSISSLSRWSARGERIHWMTFRRPSGSFEGFSRGVSRPHETFQCRIQSIFKWLLIIRNACNTLEWFCEYTGSVCVLVRARVRSVIDASTGVPRSIWIDDFTMNVFGNINKLLGFMIATCRCLSSLSLRKWTGKGLCFNRKVSW